MPHSPGSSHPLTQIKGFFPYLSVVLINAIIDLGHKIIIQNTVFKYYDGATQIALTALVNACILLPFILFFTPAGYLADRFSKHKVIAWTAGMAIPLTALIYGSYVLGWFEVAFTLTLILAAQSAFYSPAKYGYIKEMAGQSNLGMANGVVQAVTIVAILLGGILFSVIFEALIGEAQTKADILQAIAPSGLLLCVGAIAQTLIAWRIPQYQKGQKDLRLNIQKYLQGKYLKKNFKKLHAHRTIWLCVLGLSMFWAVNQVLFATFGAHLKDFAQVTSTVIVQGLLAIGGIGIILGSMTAGRLSKPHIETGIIPLAALGMTICLLMIPSMHHIFSLGLLLTVYGFFGGLFVVPLNALIQSHAQDKDLGTILAGNNFTQNIWMLAFLCGTVAASLTGLSSIPIIYILALIMALGSLFALRQLAPNFMTFILRTLFSQRYKLSISGQEHIPTSGGVLILGNHTSWIDWAVLHLAVPRPARFVMARKYYDRWYVRWFLDLYRVIPISSSASPSALRKVIQALQRGECVVLFPEGAISRNGQLGTFRRGYTIAATQAKCPIIPFYLRGLWGSRWSAVPRHFHQCSNGKRTRAINLCFGLPLPPDTQPLKLKTAIHQLSIAAWADFSKTLDSIPNTWLRVVKQYPWRLAVTDVMGQHLNHGQILASALCLAKKIRNISDSCIGIILPPGAQAVLANMSILLAGKVIVNLNPHLDPAIFTQHVKQAGLKTIVTSQKYMHTLRTLPCYAVLNQCQVLYIEEHYPKQTYMRFVSAVIRVFPIFLLQLFYGSKAHAGHPAAIVFSSQNTHPISGIVLSHANIIANSRQITSLFPPKGDDILLSSYPLYHSLGVTLSLFLPLLEAIPIVYCRDHAHGRSIGQACVKHKITLLYTTPNVLDIYVKNTHLHPLMFASLRFILCTGSHLPKSTLHNFRQKFGHIIHAGYGTSETTPLATINASDVLNPMDYSVQQGRKPNTEGLPLPGAAIRIVDPQSLEDLPQGTQGRILVGSSQIAKGYADPSFAVKTVEKDDIQWHITEDFGCLDEDGFLELANPEPISKRDTESDDT